MDSNGTIFTPGDRVRYTGHFGPLSVKANIGKTARVVRLESTNEKGADLIRIAWEGSQDEGYEESVVYAPNIEKIEENTSADYRRLVSMAEGLEDLAKVARKTVESYSAYEDDLYEMTDAIQKMVEKLR